MYKFYLSSYLRVVMNATNIHTFKHVKPELLYRFTVAKERIFRLSQFRE